LTGTLLGSSSFVLRIDIDKRGPTEIGLLLAGNFYAADIPEVARLIEEAHCAGAAAVSIDLSAVQVIDRAAVQFLTRRDAHDIAVTGCPAYVREWMLSESRRGGTGR
jgi:ABC-type transporter Mla MlaB component